MSRRHHQADRTIRTIRAEARIDRLVHRVQQSWAKRLEGDATIISLGRYQLDCVRGRGSSGAVFEGFDAKLERDVAIKVCAEPEWIAREAKALARLNHPNVVTLHDVGREDGFAYLVLELIDGWTLRELRGYGPAIDWPVWLELIAQAGRGLAAAHRACLAHGDLKPDNMLVDRHGRVRAVDFGLSRCLAEPDRDRRSAYGGTPHYRAPECWIGGPVDERRADQFSLCVALWEALFCRRPWDSTEALAAGDLAPSKGQPDAAVPARLEQALRRGLAREPDARYPDLDALLDALAQSDAVEAHDPRAAS